MLSSMKNVFVRRELFRRGGLLAAVPAFPGGSRVASAAATMTAGKLPIGAEIYRPIGVRQINCRGTFTVVAGSVELPEVRTAPEVRAAKDAAALGTHQGDFVSRDFTGSITGEDVQISSNVGEVQGAALSYRFDGKPIGDTMSDTLGMGEYLGARWTAKRHHCPGVQADSAQADVG